MYFFNPDMFYPLSFYDAGDSGGSDKSADDTGGDPDAQDKNKEGGESGGDKGKEKKTFTQEDIDKIVTDRLERDRKKREKDEKEAKEKAESAALAEQEKWKELSEKQEKRVAELEALVSELEPIKERAEKYEKSLLSFLKAEKEGLPDHILPLLDKLDVVDQLEYIAKNRATLKTQKKAGPDPTPNPADQKELSDAQKQDASKSAGNTYKRLWT